MDRISMISKSMVCKFCLKNKKLIKCHIIPTSFWQDNLDPYAEILSSNPESYPKKSQTGIYDTNLVCEDCERLFSPFDDYAYRLLLADIPSEKVFIYDEKISTYVIENYDYNRLKLFFISLLWRASSSNLPFFRSIKAKPFEGRLKEMIMKKDAGSEDDFSIALRRFKERSYSTAMLNPHKTRLDGINFVIFYLGGFKVFIKVDKRRAPDDIRNVILKPNKPLCIFLTDIRVTKEFKVMKKISEQHRSKFERK